MPSTTEQAVRRLEAALQTLEVQMLSADRAQLAESLDQVQARASKLETINRDVSRRLDSAIETIKAVLDADEDQRAARRPR
jgi:hypothetical protein